MLRKNWVELIGVIGVVASLVFVGLEIRQNTAAVRGATYQAIADASLNQVAWAADNERLLQLRVRVLDGALPKDFTPEENMLLGAAYIMTVRRMENIYVQIREGLVDEEAVLRFRPSGGYFATPYFLEEWKYMREDMEPRFREYFEFQFLN